MQLTRRLAWLGLALLEDTELAEDAERSAPVCIEVQAETVSGAPLATKTLPPATKALPPRLSSLPAPAEEGPAPAEQHLRSASRTYAASQLRSNVEKLTGVDAPMPNRPSRRPPLASA